MIIFKYIFAAIWWLWRCKPEVTLKSGLSRRMFWRLAKYKFNIKKKD